MGILDPKTKGLRAELLPNGKKRKVAMMTSGGDAPGMNAAVRAVVRSAIDEGFDAYCIFEGYEGLVQGGDLIKQMHWEDVRGWLSEGGTLIGTARCLAFYERSGRLKAAKNMVLHEINALIICGGDGSLTGADRFRVEWPSLIEELVSTGELTEEQTLEFKHLTIVGMVGSIDNDMSGTDVTIGCFSALARICEMVDYIEATASSHSRAFVIEVMGRHCGWLALMAGVATGSDFVFIPEKPRADDWREEMCTIISKVSQCWIRQISLLTQHSTVPSESARPSSLWLKAQMTSKATKSQPKRSKTCSPTRRALHWTQESRPLAMFNAVEQHARTIEHWRHYKELRL